MSEEPIKVSIDADAAPLPADVAGEPDGRHELREFFGSVSGFGRRARRQYHRIVPRRIRSRRGLLVACCVATCGGLVYNAWSARPPREMPIELQANWVTTNKGYADRPVWIGKHQVGFRVGPNPEDIEVYNVTHVDRRSVRGDTVTYDIEYAVAGGTSRWSIRHSDLPQPAIVFVHQPQMTWTVKPDLHPPVH